LRVFSLTKIYSKYIKNVGIKLASLKIYFNINPTINTNFTQYNQVLVVIFIQSNVALEYACVLFVETEVVCAYEPQLRNIISLNFNHRF
jgi:hypothetical protein